MNFGIDIDGTLTKYPAFFVEFGRAMKARGHSVFIITGLGHLSATERLRDYPDDFYDALCDTSLYNDDERSLIGKVPNNEIIVGHFKQRKCREMAIDVMFDDQADTHRLCGSVPIFGVK